MCKKGLKPVRISIKTGVSDDSYTQILADNIVEGEKVIIAQKGGGKSNKTQTIRPPRL